MRLRPLPLWDHYFPLALIAALLPGIASAQQVVAWGNNTSKQCVVPYGLGVVTQVSAGASSASTETKAETGIRSGQYALPRENRPPASSGFSLTEHSRFLRNIRKEER